MLYICFSGDSGILPEFFFGFLVVCVVRFLLYWFCKLLVISLLMS